MTLTAGTLSQSSVTDTTANLVSTAATGGTGPYTYQWYKSLTSGFSPDSGSLIDGAIALTLADSGLIPNTAYFYKVVVTDTGNGNVTDTSSQLAVTTAPQSLSQNQFGISGLIGQVDQEYAYNTKAMQVDVSETGTLYPGALVKMVDSAGGVPKVIAITADTDQVAGAINFDAKPVSYVAGSLVNVSQNGNVVYLMSTGAIGRGLQVVPDIRTMGGVQEATGLTGKRIIGWAMDKATAAGQLIRVQLLTPSFQVVS